MASKKEQKLFEGPLAEPIVLPFDWPTIENDGSVEFTKTVHGTPEAMTKIFMLFDHYEISPVDDKKWMLLSFHLAREFVPGLKEVYDDPMAALFGFPMLGGAKSNRDRSNPVLNGKRLLIIVDALKKHRGCKNDTEAAAILYDGLWDKPEGRVSQEARRKSIVTIKRRISTARKEVLGPAIIARRSPKDK